MPGCKTCLTKRKRRKETTDRKFISQVCPECIGEVEARGIAHAVFAISLWELNGRIEPDWRAYLVKMSKKS